jgi:IclR family KDG regulon transcriptional repressor
MTRDPYLLSSLKKASQILWLLSIYETLSLPELSRLLNLPKTTTYRYLYTLETTGLLSHDHPSSSYTLSPCYRDLILLMARRETIRYLLQQLHEEYAYPINLATIFGNHILYLDIVGHTRLPAIEGYHIGGSFPVHTTALGKSILAFAPFLQTRILNKPVLERRTPRSVTSAERLRNLLKAIASQGYALDCEENITGYACVAVPIQSLPSLPLSVSITFPSYKLSPSFVSSLIPQLQALASHLSKELLTMRASSVSHCETP